MDYATSFHTFFKLEVFAENREPQNVSAIELLAGVVYTLRLALESK